MVKGAATTVLGREEVAGPVVAASVPAVVVATVPVVVMACRVVLVVAVCADLVPGAVLAVPACGAEPPQAASSKRAVTSVSDRALMYK